MRMKEKIVEKYRRSLFSFTVVIAAIVGMLAPSTQANENFTPQHVAKIKSVTSAKVSPDGQLVAYLLSVPRKLNQDKDGSAWSQLHVVDMAGHARPYITGKVSIRSIQWTPDGSGISFLTKRGDDKHRALYVIPIDGGEAHKVVSHDTGVGAYSWSADGKRVAFIAKEKKDDDKKKLEDKGFTQEVYEEDFAKTRVWIATPDDEDAKPRPLDLPGVPSELHWSPVASQIAIALAPTPLVDDHYMKRKVYVYDVDDESLVSSFQNPGKLGQVAWSPDGKHLAVISAEDIHDPAAGRLMVATISDGSLIDILKNYEGHVRSVAWQNSGTIMFLGDEGVHTTLNEIGIDGSDRKALIPAGQRVLSGLSLSKDGQTAVMRSNSPSFPPEVLSMAHGQSSPKRLTDSNPWLSDMRLAKQEVINYKARDGLPLQGMLIHPLDEQPGKRYPLILAVHGGPEGNDHDGWLTRYAGPGQVAAARGFAVFYPNYRGSTGRGVAFSKLGQADYAGKEFDDYVDAVDHLIKIGLVDRDKVGITGGSYGGYAAAWGATYYTKRFAASVMFVGISNLVSKSGTTDIPNEMTLVHARRDLYDSWDFYRERSPLYYVEKARTPLLIMHGKEDPRVHPSQSMELYRQLKTKGNVPVRLVFFPGEGHGNRRAASRYDYNCRMIRWFEHYLKGPGGDPPPIAIDYGFEDKENNKDEK